MQLSTIVTEIRERIGEDVPDFWKADFIVRAVNEAQKRFAHEQRWSWLYTSGTGQLTAGVATLALQPEVTVNRQFSLMLSQAGDARKLMPVRVSPATGFRLRMNDAVSTGRPEWYYLSATEKAAGVLTYTVTFIPTPNEVWDVEYMYLRNPATLVNDADVPDLPDSYVDAIISWATGMLWLKELNGSGKAQEQFNVYNTTLAQAMQDEKSVDQGTIISWGGAQPQRRADTPSLGLRGMMPPTVG